MTPAVSPRKIVNFRVPDDHIAVVLDLLDIGMFLVAFPVDDLESRMAIVDHAFGCDEKDRADPQLQADARAAVIGLLTNEPDDSVMTRCDYVMLWLLLYGANGGDIRRWLTNVLMKRGRVMVTIATDEEGRFAFSIAERYVPLREFPEAFTQAAMELHGSAPDEVLRS